MKLVTRAQLGRPASVRADTDVHEGRVHYEGTAVSKKPLSDHDACIAQWKAILKPQLANTKENYSDIAYDYGACPHGHFLEGHGLGKRTGANGNQPLNIAHYAIVGLVGSEGLTEPNEPCSAPSATASNSSASTAPGPRSRATETATPPPAPESSCTPGSRRARPVRTGQLPSRARPPRPSARCRWPTSCTPRSTTRRQRRATPPTRPKSSSSRRRSGPRACSPAVRRRLLRHQDDRRLCPLAAFPGRRRPRRRCGRRRPRGGVAQAARRAARLRSGGLTPAPCTATDRVRRGPGGGPPGP